MSIEAKREYLEAIRKRYRKGTRQQKSRILDEFCNVCGYSRKYAIRILNRNVELRNKRPGPKPVYCEQVEKNLINLWRLMGRICSRRMKAAIPSWLPYYRESLSIGVYHKLLRVSRASIDRILATVRRKERRGLSTTKSVSWIKSNIPIELLTEKVKAPGHVEADTVAHCGDYIKGEYVHSLTLTDLYSGWTENRAVWCKSAQSIVDAIKDIEPGLPFLIETFASDNGTEFINDSLNTYFSEDRLFKVKQVRRRPYKKNDAAHVEQKNYTHVRQLFGYDRLDDKGYVLIMNQTYKSAWSLLNNFFIPSLKLKEKVRRGSKIVKKYDVPRTPYERLIGSKAISGKKKMELMHMKRKLNPFKLREALEENLHEMSKLRELNRRLGQNYIEDTK